MQSLRFSLLARLVVMLGIIHYFWRSGNTCAAENSVFVYIGTYTGEKSRGIYVSRLNPDTGQLSFPHLAAKAKNPSFLALHPNGRYLYACGEVSEFNGKPEGIVSSFSIDKNSGTLNLLNEQRSGGAGPCHVAVDKNGKWLLVANYGSGSIAALPIDRNGVLGELSTSVQHHGTSINPQRQIGPHAHFIAPDLENRFALVCDLGLDKIFAYRMDPILTTNTSPWSSVEPGSGPRHLAFHPNGHFVFVINEMASTLSSFSYDSKHGELKPVQALSTVPPEFKGQNTCAEVQVHPSGNFVYGSNRGHDSIAGFAVDAKSGRLRFLECQSGQGKTPRHFAIDPSGKWMLVESQDSDRVVVFQIDATTGRIKPTPQLTTVGAPVCAVFVPAN